MALGRTSITEDEEPERGRVTGSAEVLAFRKEDRLASGGHWSPETPPGRRPRLRHGEALVGPRLDQLVQTIESDIVPRLVLAQALPVRDDPAALAGLPPLGQAEVAAFTAVVLAGETEEVQSVVEEFRARGVTLERIYLDLFAPTARRLGQMWEDDDCDFASVTLALHQLHGLLHVWRGAFSEDPRRQDEARTALLTPLPGEQHVFGLAIVGEFLRHAGWEVTDAAVGSRRELADLVRARSYAIIGLTISREALLESLTGSIRAIRRASMNRTIGILVGGRIFAERPELVALVGADAAASDGRSAVVQAERLRNHLAAAGAATLA
jgi:methanogenic corrinoid protein MtbC1